MSVFLGRTFFSTRTREAGSRVWSKAWTCSSISACNRSEWPPGGPLPCLQRGRHRALPGPPALLCTAPAARPRVPVDITFLPNSAPNTVAPMDTAVVNFVAWIGPAPGPASLPPRPAAAGVWPLDRYTAPAGRLLPHPAFPAIAVPQCNFRNSPSLSPGCDTSFNSSHSQSTRGAF